MNAIAGLLGAVMMFVGMSIVAYAPFVRTLAGAIVIAIVGFGVALCGLYWLMGAL